MSGLRIASDPARFAEQMALYLEARGREGRLLDAEAVRRLPAVAAASPHAAEWRIRAWTADRLVRYLRRRRARRVLELGCGNGWLSALLVRALGAEVVGLDVNQPELELAALAFADVPGLSFCCGDVFQAGVVDGPFDAVVLAAAVQYFPDPVRLLRRLSALLGPEGEVVIADSPFYDPAGLESARQRTREHYQRLGVPALAAHYHHHSRQTLSGFTFLYRPDSLLARLQRRLGHPVSPFPIAAAPWCRLDRG